MIINNWQVLQNLFASKLWLDIDNFVTNQRIDKHIFPLESQVFDAFKFCSFNNTKIIILGQDPYHNKNQANGLSFAVNNNIDTPPSLRNIFKELASDTKKANRDSDLKYLAKQGVLLLNSILTVEENKPNSHQKCGWEEFSNQVIQILSANKQNLVFLLWGISAKKKKKFIDKKKHLILLASHPSPLSAYRDFFGCQHFSKANKYLTDNNIEPIKW